MKLPLNVKSLPTTVPLLRLAPLVLLAVVSFACSKNSSSQSMPSAPATAATPVPVNPQGFGPESGAVNEDSCPAGLASDFESAGTCMEDATSEACRIAQNDFVQKYGNVDCAFVGSDGNRTNVHIADGQIHVSIDDGSEGQDSNAQPAPQTPPQAPSMSSPGNSSANSSGPMNPPPRNVRPQPPRPAPQPTRPQESDDDSLSVCPPRVQTLAIKDLKMCREIENDEASAYDNELKTCEQGISDFLNRVNEIDCEVPARGTQKAFEISSDNLGEQRTRIEEALDNRSDNQDGEDAPNEGGAITNAPGPQTVIEPGSR